MKRRTIRYAKRVRLYAKVTKRTKNFFKQCHKRHKVRFPDWPEADRHRAAELVRKQTTCGMKFKIQPCDIHKVCNRE